MFWARLMGPFVSLQEKKTLSQNILNGADSDCAAWEEEWPDTATGEGEGGGGRCAKSNEMKLSSVPRYLRRTLIAGWIFPLTDQQPSTRRWLRMMMSASEFLRPSLDPSPALPSDFEEEQEKCQNKINKNFTPTFLLTERWMRSDWKQTDVRLETANSYTTVVCLPSS